MTTQVYSGKNFTQKWTFHGKFSCFSSPWKEVKHFILGNIPFFEIFNYDYRIVLVLGFHLPKVAAGTSREAEVRVLLQTNLEKNEAMV